MIEPIGNIVNLVLTVEDGKGMEHIKNPIVIAADLNGRVLESDPISPTECPIFNTELVWEVTRSELCKNASSNIPLRVECYTEDVKGYRNKFGLVLLSLRSARVVSKDSQDAAFKWRQMTDVSSDVKSRHPELYLSLFIQDSLAGGGEANQNPSRIKQKRDGSTRTICSGSEDICKLSEDDKQKDDITTAMPSTSASLLCFEYFCLHLFVKTLTWKKRLPIKHYQISFSHPRAETSVRFKRDMQNDKEQIFKDVQCRMYFVCPSSHLTTLLSISRPKLTLLDGRQAAISDTVELQSKQFPLNLYSCTTETVLLRTLEETEPLSEITIETYVEGLERFPVVREGDLYPSVFHESIILLQISQFEEFKQKLKDDLRIQNEEKLNDFERVVARQNEFQAEAQAKF